MSQITIRSSRPPSVAECVSPAGLLGTLRRQADLTRQFAARDVLERHKGAYLGLAWNLVNPLITLAIYTFVFGYVFESRWQEATDRAGPGAGHAATAFVLPFFLGHAIFHYFSECVNRAPVTVGSRPNLVRRVVFPVEILPVVGAIAAGVYPLICIPLLLIAQALLTQTLHATALWLPVVLAPLVLMCLGLSWLLAAVGVYVRDVRHVVVVATQLIMFMTPVFYPVERILANPRIPHAFKVAYSLNPLNIVIESARDVVLWGRQPDWAALAILTLVSLLVMQAGYAVFMRTRRGFADAV